MEAICWLRLGAAARSSAAALPSRLGRNSGDGSCLGKSANKRSITAAAIVTRIAARRLTTTRVIAAISSSLESGLATELGTCEKVQGEITRVFWCRLFARARPLIS